MILRSILLQKRRRKFECNHTFSLRIFIVYTHRFHIIFLHCEMSFSCFPSNESTTPLPSFDINITTNDQPWWITFSSCIRRSRWQPPQWNNHCSFCNALLLSGEQNRFCCSNGRKIPPPLPPLPPRLLTISQDRHMSSQSQRLNSLFSFTAIGASKGFQTFETGLWNVAITGRTYHRLFDISDTQHRLHWYLYDEMERFKEGKNRKIPSTWIQAFEDDMKEVNPYVHHLHQFSCTWNANPHACTALELSDITATGDFAAIMHTNNSVDVSPRSIVIWHNSSNTPSFIPIFSCHYEPLQYPLLFPQGTVSWG
jgi:hypothetical protein